MKKTLAIAAAFATAGAFADTPNAAYEIWPEGKIPFALESPKPEGVEPMRDDIVRLSRFRLTRRADI